MIAMDTIQTRIPCFLWDALQDVFYQQDYEFLREVSKLTRVPLPELKRTLLGARGALTTISVAKTANWWEGEQCPMMVRTSLGLWKPCGFWREAHGACCNHRQTSATVKHRDDTYFKSLPKRNPIKWEGEIVWVSETGDVVRENGEPVKGLRICWKSAMILL
jgi:hypothetical protein